MTRVAINPALFRWARDRSRIDAPALLARFPQLPSWENAKVQPTLKQLENYARATHAPIGFFFLPVPPQESLPIPDFRTFAGRAESRRRRPSSTISSVEPYRDQAARWFDQGVGGVAIHVALCRQHGYTGSYSSVTTGC